jgi:hypothetical protein
MIARAREVEATLELVRSRDEILVYHTGKKLKLKSKMFLGLEVRCNGIRANEIIIDKVLLKQVKVDFGVIDSKGKINGLLGRDLLQKAHSVIDLKNMMMTVDQ